MNRLALLLLPLGFVMGMPRAQEAPRGPQANHRAEAPFAYVSPFAGYRGFGEQKVQPWRESNDLVRRIGGWKAYVNEPDASRDGRRTEPAKEEPAQRSHGGHR